MQAHFTGGLRQALDVSALRCRKALHVTEQEGRPQSPRKLSDGAAQHLPGLLALCLLIGKLAPSDQWDWKSRRVLLFLRQGESVVATTQQHQRMVIGNAIEPCTQPRVRLEAVDGLKSRQKRGLHDLFRVILLFE